MPPSSSDSLALVLLVFVLGLKHGFDADHLAAIDGLTRYNLRQAPARARDKSPGPLCAAGREGDDENLGLALRLAQG